ncbi:RsiV family protein [Pedobacter borealis]|uniref:RsiV family protein n=1 Tax=Pedobacter borealis TaxID=475254 RepID=UPI0004934837|nr:RsiV family protein [Pedobacter borealis]
MKYYLHCFLFGLLIISACNNPKNGGNTTETTNDSTANAKAELTESFYKRLEGTIAGKKVVMHLQKVDDDVSGTYYYDGSWLNLSTDTLIGKDSLVLTEYSFYESYFTQDFKSPHLALKWNGYGFNGNWESGDKIKKYPIVLTEKYPEGSYPFSTGIYKDSVKAFANQPKSPAAEISFEYLESKNNDEYGNWLNSELKKISGLKLTVDRSIGFKNIAAAYFKDYKTQVTEQSKNSRGDDFQAWMNYTNNSQQSVNYNDNGYVVIEFLADAYTGGAHGNYSSLMFCLDVKNKKQMVLSDIIKIDSNTLQGVLERNLRKEYNIKAKNALSTVLFDDFIKPNNNFYFNANGIAFMYNPYEVASYAQGQIVIFIPYSDLKTYLVPAFAQRMGIK